MVIPINPDERYNSITYQMDNPLTKRRLIDYIREHNEELYNYLGIDFGWN